MKRILNVAALSVVKGFGVETWPAEKQPGRKSSLDSKKYSTRSSKYDVCVQREYDGNQMCAGRL